jgi:protein SCO1
VKGLRGIRCIKGGNHEKTAILSCLHPHPVCLFGSFRSKDDIGPPDFKEKLGSLAPLDLPFADEQGKNVTFRQVMGKKPAILTLIYFRCPGKCSPLLNNLADTLAALKVDPKKYVVLTVSIDPTENPELVKEKKKNYFNTFEKPFPEETWRFLTGNEENIRKLADSVGYSYRFEDGQFVHPLGLVFLSPEGKITRYLNGIVYLPFDLEMGLLEASKGMVGAPVKRALLLCYAYDPGSRKYELSITKIAGLATLFFIALYILIFLLRGA